jgi:OOP family OmpA-OmpF porin
MKIIISLFLLILPHFSKAQNLVSNGDFEMNIGCTVLNGMLVHDALPWNSSGFADYFNVCNSSALNGVPRNAAQLKGYQWPHSGNAYAGFNTYLALGTNFRDYVWAPLNDTLIIGYEYCVEFYVNLFNASTYGNDAIGAYFCDTAISCPSFNCLFLDTPQIVSPLGVAITDTLNWTKVSGSFIAKGGEHFILIGNFLQDSQLTIAINDTTQQFSTAYYIDDVSVFKCDSSSSVNSIKKELDITVFPNPANTTITLSTTKVIAEVALLHVCGQVLLQQKQVKVIVVSELDNGLYMLRCKFQDGEVLYKKIVVQHD